MPITILELLSADTIGSAVEKINYNFDQLLLNGGGSPGIAGPIGPAGIPGIQGNPGIVWTSGVGTPVATGGNTGDLYLEDNGDVWEYDSGTTNWTNTGLSILGPVGPSGSAATTYFDILDTSNGTSPGDDGPGFDVVFPVLDTDLLNRPVSTDIRAGLFGAYPNGYDILNPVPFDNLYLNIGISTLFLHQPAGGYHIVFTNSDSPVIIDVDNIVKYPFIQSDATDKLFIATQKDATALSLDGIELNAMDTNLSLKSGRNITIETSGNPINDLSGITENGNIDIVALDIIDAFNVTPNDVLVRNTLKDGATVVNEAGLKLFSPSGTKVSPGFTDLKAAFLYAGEDDTSIYNMGIGDGQTYNIFLNPENHARIHGNLLFGDPALLAASYRSIIVEDNVSGSGGDLLISAGRPSAGQTPGDTFILGAREDADPAGNVYLSNNLGNREGSTVVGKTSPVGLFNIGITDGEYIRFYDDIITIENWDKIDWYTADDYVINIGTVAGASAEAFKIKQDKDVVMGLSGGFFGIFQNNPQAGLHIGSTIDLLYTHASMIISDNQPSIMFGNSDAGYTIGAIGEYDYGFNISLTTDVTSFKINTKTDTELFWNPIETPFQIETSTGKVGINMAPIVLSSGLDAQLQVDGGIYITGAADVGDSSKGNILFSILDTKTRKIGFSDEDNAVESSLLSIRGSSAQGGLGSGGNIEMIAGYGNAGGGDLLIESGGSTDSLSGSLTVRTGISPDGTGILTLRTGFSSNGNSGKIDINSGVSNFASGASGDINLKVGNAFNPGDINLACGTDFLSNVIGKIYIGGENTHLLDLPDAISTHYVHVNGGTGKLSMSASAASSSIRFKENISELQLDSSKIFDLVPKSFEYIKSFDQHTAKKRVHGYLAEEVLDILPEVVILDEESKPMGIYYDKLVIPIIEEVKKQKEKIEYLEDKINKLMELINGTK